MARHTTDREDLIREATALVERVELAPVGAPHSEHVTAGFRAGGAASLFFGADPVYQFNADGELRRAFCEGLMFKAVGGRLVSLRRVRRLNEVQLLRHELTDAEQLAFLAELSERLRQLTAELARGDFTLVGKVPAAADVEGRLKQWLTERDHIIVAATPHA